MWALKSELCIIVYKCFFLFSHKQIYKSDNVLVSYFLVGDMWLCCVAILLRALGGLRIAWTAEDKGHHLESPFPRGDMSAWCSCLRETPVQNQPKPGQDRSWFERQKNGKVHYARRAPDRITTSDVLPTHSAHAVFTECLLCSRSIKRL